MAAAHPVEASFDAILSNLSRHFGVAVQEESAPPDAPAAVAAAVEPPSSTYTDQQLPGVVRELQELLAVEQPCPVERRPAVGPVGFGATTLRASAMTNTAHDPNGLEALRVWEEQHREQQRLKAQSVVDRILLGTPQQLQQRKEHQALELRKQKERERELEQLQLREQARARHKSRQQFLDMMDPKRARQVLDVKRAVHGSRLQQQAVLRKVARNSGVVARMQSRTVSLPSSSSIPSKRGAKFPGK